MTKTTTVDCYNCHSGETEPFLRENGFWLVRCKGCGLLYIRERPDEETIEIATAIGQHHGEQDLDANVHYNPGVKAEYRRFLPEIFPDGFAGIGSWLDIGCGYGEFIETLTERSHGSIDVVGSEPNMTKQASAKKRNLNVDYFDLATHPRQYDVVSLLNVYSHLPDPYEFISGLKRVIKPGGEFLIQTGNSADFSAEDILKPLGLPDHLSFTSESILTDMLERIGFKVVSVHKFPDLPIEPKKIAKEIAKFILPKYNSYLKYYANYRKYSESKMFIRARLPAES